MIGVGTFTLLVGCQKGHLVCNPVPHVTKLKVVQERVDENAGA